jgi:hypothetical protein
MTKEEKREYAKKYGAANKEKIAAKRKAWRENNKEREAARKKAWNENNKEKVAAYRKDYYQDNRERTIARNKAYVESKKHEPVVYYLPEHHYVGVTDCLFSRLKNHRSNSNRITEGYEIIYNAKDITEARAVERYMHYEMGYNGKKGGTKGY